MRFFVPALVALPIALSTFSLGCAKGETQAQATATPTTNASAPSPSPALSPSPSLSPLPAPALGEGTAAPDFSTTDQNGKPIHLADLKGRNVVLYFYPKDETPGCTKEACSFRDAWNELGKKAVMIGISMDSGESHKAFAEHHKLPFLLVSDSNGDIAAKYGVPVENGHTRRQTFVIGADGNVKKIYRSVDVTRHASEITADVQ